MGKYIIDLPENTHWIQWIMEGTKDHHPYMDFKQVEDLTPYTEPDMEQVRKEGYQQGYKDGYNNRDIEKIRKRGYDKGLDDIGNALRLLLFQYSNYTLQEMFGYDTVRAVVEHYEGSEIVARIRCYEGGVKQDAETIRKEAYDKAFEDAEQVAESGKRAMYQKGLSDAWDAARKIIVDDTSGGFSTSIFCEIFGYKFTSHDVLKTLNAAEAIEKIRQYEQRQKESEEPKKEQSVTAEEVMRQYLDIFCKGKGCTRCPLHTPDFTCGRGYHFLTHNRISDEEVRRAYAEVLQKMREN